MKVWSLCGNERRSLSRSRSEVWSFFMHFVHLFKNWIAAGLSAPRNDGGSDGVVESERINGLPRRPQGGRLAKTKRGFETKTCKIEHFRHYELNPISMN